MLVEQKPNIGIPCGGSEDYPTNYNGDAQLKLFDTGEYRNSLLEFFMKRNRVVEVPEPRVYNPMHDFRQLSLDFELSRICIIY